MTAPDNPMGLDGFEFVEFTSPDPEALADLFERLGFTHFGNHRSKNVRHYTQGDVNLILNMEPSGQPADFRHAHGGAGVAGFGFFDGIHRKRADGIGQVITGWHCVPFC